MFRFYYNTHENTESIAFRGGGDMENEKNLVQDQCFTPEAPKKTPSKAEIARGSARKVKKTLKDELILLLAQGDTQERLSLALIEKATNGDLKAFELIRDIIGQKPPSKQEAEVSGVLSIELGGELKKWAK